jgi:anti-sigma regulatory factor (Ser/Thr protein kinase)
MTNSVDRLKIAADLEELTRTQIWLAERAEHHQLASTLVYALDVCLEEAISNIARHGAVGPGEQSVDLALEVAADKVRLVIEDEGPPFDPTQAAPPALADRIEEASIGGLGIHLMQRLSSSLVYQRRHDRNCLTLEFARSSAG